MKVVVAAHKHLDSPQDLGNDRRLANNNALLNRSTTFLDETDATAIATSGAIAHLNDRQEDLQQQVIAMRSTLKEENHQHLSAHVKSRPVWHQTVNWTWVAMFLSGGVILALFIMLFLVLFLWT